ncbi:MAG: HNH endonuclease [Candidatus Omnitrophica bacterium]|nr:HNH endonuclease [Candidatus Omnitrophota bacterium]
MPFSEKIKKQVKENAAFKCCRCQSIGIEAHHIIPEGQGGPNTLDNAAPLCPTCHDWFGDNPKKQKEIKHMRDWWYKQCKKIYSKKEVVSFSKIDSKLEKIKNGQSQGINELKEILKNMSNKAIDSISATTASATASTIVNSMNIARPIIIDPEPVNELISGLSLFGEKIHFCSSCGFGYKVSDKPFYTSYYGAYSITCPKCSNVEYYNKPL